MGAAHAFDAHVQNAAPSHLDALLADEAHARRAGDQAESHHVGGQRTGGAAGRGIFRDAEFGREHSGVCALGSRSEHEHAGRLVNGAGEVFHPGQVDPGAVDSRGVLHGDKNDRRAGAHPLRCELEKFADIEAQCLRRRLTVVGRALRDDRRAQPDQRTLRGPGFHPDRNRAHRQLQPKVARACRNQAFLQQHVRRADGGMSGKGQFPGRREDAHARGAVEARRRQNERGLREVQFAGDALHFALADSPGVREHRQRVPLHGSLGEDVDDTIAMGVVIHGVSLLVRLVQEAYPQTARPVQMQNAACTTSTVYNLQSVMLPACRCTLESRKA